MTPAQELELFIDRLGLRHFRGRELTPYWSQVRGGVRNACPPEALWPKIIPTLVVLDELRSRLGYALRITSSYRRPAYNAAVGGEPGSFHQRFQAIDFQGTKGTPEDWAGMLRSMREVVLTLPVNGGRFAFRGGIGTYPTFCHIDTRGYQATW